MVKRSISLKMVLWHPHLEIMKSWDSLRETLLRAQLWVCPDRYEMHFKLSLLILTICLIPKQQNPTFPNQLHIEYHTKATPHVSQSDRNLPKRKNGLISYQDLEIINIKSQQVIWNPQFPTLYPLQQLNLEKLNVLNKLSKQINWPLGLEIVSTL